MRTGRVRFPLIAGFAVAVGAIVATALPAGASVSLQSQSPPVAAVKLGPKAKLDARGAVVFPTVKVTCAPGDFALLTVQVTEAVGKDIASGASSQQVSPCTGAVQKFTVAVTPVNHPFRKGVAFGQAWLDVCNGFSCHTFRDFHNIQIVK
jgi:hypothetical protein